MIKRNLLSSVIILSLSACGGDTGVYVLEGDVQNAPDSNRSAITNSMQTIPASTPVQVQGDSATTTQNNSPTKISSGNITATTTLDSSGVVNSPETGNSTDNQTDMVVVADNDEQLENNTTASTDERNTTTIANEVDSIATDNITSETTSTDLVMLTVPATSATTTTTTTSEDKSTDSTKHQSMTSSDADLPANKHEVDNDEDFACLENYSKHQDWASWGWNTGGWKKWLSQTDSKDWSNHGWGWNQQTSCKQDSDASHKSGLSLAELGGLIYNDENLSSPRGQSCASCHSAEHGFTEPDSKHPSSLGANGADFGNRNSPTVFYAAHIPDRQIVSRPNPLTLLPQDVVFGGLFIDGRAVSLEEQAKLPFFNPIEMALSGPQELATRIQGSQYAKEFEAYFGGTVFEDADLTLDSVATAIAAFERSSVFSPFNSKFDHVQEGSDTFTMSEMRGKELFEGKANCSLCHTSPDDGPETFSDYLYHSVGTPRNETLLNNIGNVNFVDNGLGAETGIPFNNGQFRTPTLRNITLTAPYMHNGVFDTLREVVDFYNTNATAPEVPGINIPPFIGNLGLTDKEVDDLIAYLEALTDY